MLQIDSPISLYPRVGHAIQMVPTNFQKQIVSVAYAHFVPRCMSILLLATYILQHAMTPKPIWLPGYRYMILGCIKIMLEQGRYTWRANMSFWILY